LNDNKLVISESLQDEVLSLPISSVLDNVEVQYIASKINDF
jgi:hypothetical protein